MLQLQQKRRLFECLPQTSKKLVSVLATSAPITGASKEDKIVLEKVPYIHYLLRFQKDINEMRALIDSASEVNAITPAYASKLGLRARRTDVEI